MSSLELFILKWLGVIITECGFLGLILCIFINVFTGYAPHFGRLQAIGSAICLGVMVFGMITTKFLWQVRKILEDYLRS